LNSGHEDLIFDFSKVSYIDSSALGMMVLVNKKAKAKGRSVIIQNAMGAALEVLTIANFQQMFTFK
jgi:anti-anti-sigma factor